jgi:TonB family protein
MIRSDHSLAVALCVSIVAHAATMFVVVGRALDEPVRLVSSLSPRRTTSATESASPVYLAPKPPPPPPDLLFGDLTGTGDAANSSPGDERMIGRDVGEVQAFLSRDPAGAGDVGEEPTMNVLPPGASRSAHGAPAAPTTPLTVASVQPLAVEPLSLIGVRAREAVPLVHRPIPIREQRAPLAVPAVTEQASRLNELIERPAHGNVAPGSSSSLAADPAMMSDSESDPFAHGTGEIEFRDGSVDVRFGRKVKTVRPRLSLAARYELLGMQYPRMVVRVQVEASGAVRNVDIVKSSGSRSADQEVKVALYQWWIEPPKNKRGVALADVVEFPILWR